MKKRTLIFAALFAFCCLINVYAGDNADLTPEEAFGRIFAKDGTGINTLFDDAFLKVVGEKRLKDIIKIYRDELGNFQKVEHLNNEFKLHFSGGTATARLHINANNRIDSLWFSPPQKSADSLDEIIAALSKLPDRVSICIMRHKAAADSEATPEILAELNADQPMAVGSTFKLFLLQALEDDVAAGRRSWSDIIELKEEWKSFPSGILQDWAAGSRHSLETLAGLMISISDNTATDHIFHLLGTEKVREYFPETCKDVLNTSQLLKMKFFFPTKAQQFIKASPEEKRGIVAEMDSIGVASIASYSAIYSLNKPVLIDELEWLVSTRKLCETIWKLRDSSRIKINSATGLVDKTDWHTAGFKGGSEPGVLNYSWVLQKTASSPVYTVSCTANNSDKNINSDAFNAVVARIINFLQKE